MYPNLKTSCCSKNFVDIHEVILMNKTCLFIENLQTFDIEHPCGAVL